MMVLIVLACAAGGYWLLAGREKRFLFKRGREDEGGGGELTTKAQRAQRNLETILLLSITDRVQSRSSKYSQWRGR
jgi:hypothetical protein